MEVHLSVKDLAEREGVPEGTIYQWVSRGGGPPVMRVGRFLRFRLPDVEAWEESRIRVPPANAGPRPKNRTRKRARAAASSVDSSDGQEITKPRRPVARAKKVTAAAQKTIRSTRSRATNSARTSRS